MPLFKYTTHFGVDIVRNLQLKVTPPNELNDPFEFSPYVEGKVTPEHIEELMRTIPPREVYDELVRNGIHLPTFEEFEQFVRLTTPLFVQHGAPTYQSAYEEIVAAQLDSVSKKMGLICFSEEENNILLWSHYTDSHRGILLEFDITNNYFKENSRFLRVDYSTKRIGYDPLWPDDSPELERHCENVLSTKNCAWAYEKEWRSLFPLHWCHQKIVNGQTLYFTDIPPDLVTRVVLGYRCPLNVQRQVLEAREQRKLGCSVYRAFLHPREFRMEYKPI